MQPGFPREQAAVVNCWVLSWSEKVLATCGPVPFCLPVSVTPELTLSNDPVTLVIRLVTLAVASPLVLPTVCGGNPDGGVYGCRGAALHRALNHSTLG